MEPATQSSLHHQLLQRRAKLESALSHAPDADDLVRLLLAVDAAIEKLDGGSYGLCIVCGGRFEDHELEANPLIQYCLCSLSPEQMRHLERDLQLATRIQQSLLPPQDVEWRGWMAHFRYLPAGPVSGDYCDLVTSPGADGADTANGDLWFVVGDVSGKGVAAALRMAHMNAAFRTTIHAGVGLAELTGRMNKLLSESGVSQYASLVAGRARPDGTVELCNAGHPPPLLRRRNRIVPVEAGGFPLGLVRAGDYTTESVTLDPGESLLLYTDGITEARDAAGEEYGAGRLGQVMLSRQGGSPGELAAACLADHQSFSGARQSQDDRTLLVLQRAA